MRTSKRLQVFKRIRQSLLQMIGLPDYETYLAHQKKHHPEKTPMTYEEFFRERQESRYGGKVGAKCC